MIMIFGYHIHHDIFFSTYFTFLTVCFSVAGSVYASLILRTLSISAEMVFLPFLFLFFLMLPELGSVLSTL